MTDGLFSVAAVNSEKASVLLFDNPRLAGEVRVQPALPYRQPPLSDPFRWLPMVRAAPFTANAIHSERAPELTTRSEGDCIRDG
jgi:hypothetical protein